MTATCLRTGPRPASPALLSGNSRRGKFFLDASTWQLESHLSRGGRLGSDGASLKRTVDAFVDPIGIRGGINLYGYVGNGPMNATDPWGEERYNNLGDAVRAEKQRAHNCTLVVLIGHTQFTQSAFSNLAKAVSLHARKGGPLNCWWGGMVACQSKAATNRLNLPEGYEVPNWPTTANTLSFEKMPNFAAQSIEFGLRSFAYLKSWCCKSITVHVWLDAESAWVLQKLGAAIRIPLLNINANQLYGTDKVSEEQPPHDLDGSTGVYVNEFQVDLGSISSPVGGPSVGPDPTAKK